MKKTIVTVIALSLLCIAMPAAAALYNADLTLDVGSKITTAAVLPGGIAIRRREGRPASIDAGGRQQPIVFPALEEALIVQRALDEADAQHARAHQPVQSRDALL